MSSLYSTSLKVDYFDPRLDQQNNRLEFRLNPDTCYYSNLRLANFGCTAPSDQPIVGLAGLYSLIKHVRLLDGNVEIDSCRFANRYLAFKNVNNKNADNLSLTQHLSKANVGYVINTLAIEDRGNMANDDVRAVADHKDLNNAHLDLRVCLPILEQISYLDTSLMPNLRIVIELDMSARNIINNHSLALNSTQNAVLIADEIMDDKVKSALKSSFKGVAWNTIEHDLVQVPSQETAAAALGVGGEATQNVSLRLNAYDNKILGRVVMMKEYSDITKYNVDGTTTRGYGPLSSLAMMGEKVNLRLNGGNVFSGDGLNTSAKLASVLSDTWGPINIEGFCNQLSAGVNNVKGANGNPFGVGFAAPGDNQSTRIGQSSYIGLEVAARVSQLSLEYERTIPKDADALKTESSGLNVHVYGEVQKSLMVQNGEYKISYA